MGRGGSPFRIGRSFVELVGISVKTLGREVAASGRVSAMISWWTLGESGGWRNNRSIVAGEERALG